MLDVTNVTSRFDPTGTAGIRRSFRADAQRRLSQLRSVTHQQLVERDFMAHRDDPLREMYPQSAADPHERLAAFAQWFKNATTQSLGGSWWQRHVEKAWASGQQAGAGLVGGVALSPWVPGTYGVAAQAEIDGIGAALHQHVVRNLAEAVRRRIKPQLMYRPLLGSLRKIGTHRLNMFANTTTVRLHNAGRLNAFLAAGINRVGVVPERLVVRPSTTLREGLRAQAPTHDHFADKGLLETLRRALEYLLPGEEGLAGDLHSAMSGSSKLSEKQAFRVGQTMERVTKIMGAVGEVRSAPRMVPKPDRPEIPKRAVPLPWFKPDIGVEQQASLVGELGKVLTRLPPGDRKLAGDLLLASTGSRGLSERQSELVGRLIGRAAPEGEGIAAEIPLIGKGGAAMSERERAALIGQAEKAKARFEKIGLWNIATAGDDLVCEACSDAAEDTYTADEAQGLLPLHPNAVLEGTSIASYGAMHEVVRAKFVGSAVYLRTRSKFFAIGPNHPMLTRRGWQRARDLHEGDELLYDLRVESFSTSEIFDFEQMPMVEDIFDASSLLRRSRRATALHDLHGDRIFCEGEIDVVHPARRLLPIFDLRGVEHFSKDVFERANMQTAFVARLRASFAPLERIFLAAPSFMRRSDLTLALAGGHARPLDALLFAGGAADNIGMLENAINQAAACAEFYRQGEDAGSGQVGNHDWPFRWDRVLAVHVRQFSGWAFDASTASGLYNNEGYIISNCRCALVPAGEKSEEDEED